MLPRFYLHYKYPVYGLRVRHILFKRGILRYPRILLKNLSSRSVHWLQREKTSGPVNRSVGKCAIARS